MQVGSQAKPQVKEVKKLNLQYECDKDRQIVTGIAKNYECPGGLIEFVFRKYKQDKTERYKLMDGEVCKIPLGVAKHLNKNCWYPIHTLSTDENGKPSHKIGQKVRRYGFQSLEFLDEGDLGSYGQNEIVTVEKIVMV
jgi:hypothetical protein